MWGCTQHSKQGDVAASMGCCWSPHWCHREVSRHTAMGSLHPGALKWTATSPCWLGLELQAYPALLGAHKATLKGRACASVCKVRALRLLFAWGYPCAQHWEQSFISELLLPPSLPSDASQAASCFLITDHTFKATGILTLTWPVFSRRSDLRAFLCQPDTNPTSVQEFCLNFKQQLIVHISTSAQSLPSAPTALPTAPQHVGSRPPPTQHHIPAPSPLRLCHVPTRHKPSEEKELWVTFTVALF